MICLANMPLPLLLLSLACSVNLVPLTLAGQQQQQPGLSRRYSTVSNTQFSAESDDTQLFEAPKQGFLHSALRLITSKKGRRHTLQLVELQNELARKAQKMLWLDNEQQSILFNKAKETLKMGVYFQQVLAELKAIKQKAEEEGADVNAILTDKKVTKADPHEIERAKDAVVKHRAKMAAITAAQAEIKGEIGSNLRKKFVNYVHDRVPTNTYYLAALQNWRHSTLANWHKYRLESWLGGEERRVEGPEDTVTNRLNAVMELEARRYFAWQANKVLKNLSILSGQMGPGQIKECIEMLKPFAAIKIVEDPTKMASRFWTDKEERIKKPSVAAHWVQKWFRPYSIRGQSTHEKELAAKMQRFLSEMGITQSQGTLRHHENALKIATFLRLFHAKALGDEVKQTHHESETLKNAYVNTKNAQTALEAEEKKVREAKEALQTKVDAKEDAAAEKAALEAARKVRNEKRKAFDGAEKAVASELQKINGARKLAKTDRLFLHEAEHNGHVKSLAVILKEIEGDQNNEYYHTAYEAWKESLIGNGKWEAVKPILEKETAAEAEADDERKLAAIIEMESRKVFLGHAEVAIQNYARLSQQMIANEIRQYEKILNSFRGFKVEIDANALFKNGGTAEDVESEGNYSMILEQEPTVAEGEMGDVNAENAYSAQVDESNSAIVEEEDQTKETHEKA